MGTHESGQVRKEAALSGISHVPQGCLNRANDRGSAYVCQSKEGARHTYFYTGVCSLSMRTNTFFVRQFLGFERARGNTVCYN